METERGDRGRYGNDKSATGFKDFVHRLPAYNKGLLKQCVSFHFYNFPEDWEAKQLFFFIRRAVKEGRLWDIFIPSKRDKRGNRYGFARFLDARDYQTMKKQLENMWIGNRRVIFNPAEDRREERRRTTSKLSEKARWFQVQKVIEATGTDKVEEKLMKCDVGMALSPSIIPSLLEIFFNEGFPSIKIVPMGGNFVLINGDDPESIQELVDGNLEWVSHYFDQVKIWSPSDIAEERFVWARIQGLPLHAWTEENLLKIGNQVGKCVSVDKYTLSKECLDVARVLVSTKYKSAINEEFILRVKGNRYNIAVVEENWRNDPWWLKKVHNSITESEVSSSKSNPGDDFGEFECDCSNGPKGGEIQTPLKDVSGINYPDNLRGSKQVVEENREIGGTLSNQEREKQSEGNEDNQTRRNLNSNGKVPVTKDRVAQEIAQFRSPSGSKYKAQCDEHKLGSGKKEGSEFQAFVSPIKSPNTAAEIRVESMKLVTRTKRGKRRKARVQPINFGGVGNTRLSIRRGYCLQQQKNQGKNDLQGSKEGAGSGKKDRDRCQKSRRADSGKIHKNGRKRQAGVWSRDTKALVGRSGGVLCIWDKKFFEKVSVVEKPRALAIFGLWGEKKQKCCIVNVYASCNRNERMETWTELLKMIEEGEGFWEGFSELWEAWKRREMAWKQKSKIDWIQQGDANSKLFHRIANGNRLRKMIRGIHKDGSWVEEPNIVKQEVREYFRKIFQDEQWDMPKLDGLQFKQLTEENRIWLERAVSAEEEFSRNSKLECLQTASISILVNGSPTEEFKMEKGIRQGDPIAPFLFLIVAEGLNVLIESAVSKEALKGIDVGPFGLSISHLQFADDTVIMGKADPDNIKAVKGILRWFELLSGLKINFNKSVLYSFNASDEWGRMVVAALNCKSGIHKDGSWVEEPNIVKQEVREYFRKFFQDDQWDKPKLDGLQFKQLTEEDRIWLERAVSAEEVKQAVWECGGDKSPGPDGFSFHLIRACWTVIEKDVVEFVQDFSRNGKLVRGLNSSFIVLIPKKSNPEDLKDYRPISLINSLYKIISKVLANRIKKVLPKVISGTQSAFLGGRQITDGVLILNEVIEEIKKKKVSSFIFKGNFEKSYDCVNWDFSDEMMRRLGFGEKWRMWIKECLQTASISILANGSPTEEFKMERGIRQGDPIAPFLFLVVVEGLNVLIESAISKEALKGIDVGPFGLNISHLQFADDTVIMGKADPDNIKAVKGILRWFELLSGLKINFNKSVLYSFNASDEWGRMAVAALNCISGSLPFTYLEMPVGDIMCRRKAWKPVIDNFSKKLAVWKAKSLSIGGRVTLLRKFLWGYTEDKSKLAWLSWEKVCRNRSEGGLGVPNLDYRNIALLGKWWDRFGKEEGSLWKKVVIDKFYGGGSVWDINQTQLRNVSTLWRNIVELGEKGGNGSRVLKEGFGWKVGMGDKVKFWVDKWIGTEPLNISFPRLFNLTSNKDALVMEVGQFSNDSWIWKNIWRHDFIGRERDEEQRIKEIILRELVLSSQPDQRRWSFDTANGYTVRKAYSLMAGQNRLVETRICRKLWGKLIPSKISCFGWRLILKGLSTKAGILKRGIQLQEEETFCCICIKELEDDNHLFATCPKIQSLWMRCYNWWGISLTLPNTISLLCEAHSIGIKKWVGGLML
ncbi:hypothetical protein SLEP1_g5176 [Rubroshorea leprosula]|uniref:Reverse transcriptase domain-containing protein n=1 Tax=Rubroshorea leprosula TaxID=152421 RepID=A0AAV5I019_9ROSI|nr:hypothetical protein SLEP1_g5176 [Rubroshorea leprosula]